MQHIIDYRNKYTLKNSNGDPVTFDQARLSGKYENSLWVDDPETKECLILREASREEVATAFANSISSNGGHGDYAVDVDINGVMTRCYVNSGYSDSWRDSRLVTDNLKVNDGKVTYYTYDPYAWDSPYEPTEDQDYFEHNYDGDVDGEVTATLTNLVTGEEWVWSFTPKS